MIEYRTSLDGIASSQLHGFFADWPHPPTAETHLKILDNSYRCVLAVDTDIATATSVVGFVYAISDGALSAYIPLLEVRPSHKKCGIGKQLMRRLVEQLPDLYMIDLVCDPSLVGYYEKLGMSPLAGMAFRNYDSLRGPC